MALYPLLMVDGVYKPTCDARDQLAVDVTRGTSTWIKPSPGKVPVYTACGLWGMRASPEFLANSV